MKSNKRAAQRDTHREITDYIVKAIEDGASTFKMPWHGTGGDLGGFPRNVRTGADYKGVNVLTLWISAVSRGYGSSEWATFRQWRDLGAHIRKGEKGSPVVFYKELEREVTDDQTGEKRNGKVYFARTSWVFNAEQVNGYEPDRVEPERKSLVEVVKGADRFVEATGADIRIGGTRAYFSPTDDYIAIPDKDRFTGSATSTPTEAYYAVLLHELTHWSGAKPRLDRDMGERFGTHAYAMEELVAELGAAFLCADLGMSNSPRPDHAAYVANWLEIMKADKRAIFTAASKAREAVGYLDGSTR